MSKISPIDRELKSLRRQQADRVMPKVGALLDCWENTPLDARCGLEQDFPHLCEIINALQEAVEGDGE
jgi:hypothetical protein